MKAWFAAAVGADVTLGTDAANAERTPPEASRKKKRDSMKKTFFLCQSMHAIASFFSPQPPSNTHTVLHLHDRGLLLR